MSLQTPHCAVRKYQESSPKPNQWQSKWVKSKIIFEEEKQIKEHSSNNQQQIDWPHKKPFSINWVSGVINDLWVVFFFFCIGVGSF